MFSLFIAFALQNAAKTFSLHFFGDCSAIRVSMYEDEIEISLPGGLPAGLS